MTFIKLTMPNDTEIFINLALVRDIFVSKDSITTLSFDNEYYIKVKESPSEIFKYAEEKVNT